ncbi:hypothetical protein Mgra_00005589 [Meloidogyne graminicola]|uniref:Uncharacterized protein n=1 Tax=Meloidogyne graminicola TaxID=189291 RepID=A0A8S9ZP57_9BILA|nr:hypothetical protein Mgra_00005589 [Meloidogyne graminicola]
MVLFQKKNFLIILAKIFI